MLYKIQLPGSSKRLSYLHCSSHMSLFRFVCLLLFIYLRLSRGPRFWFCKNNKQVNTASRTATVTLCSILFSTEVGMAATIAQAWAMDTDRHGERPLWQTINHYEGTRCASVCFIDMKGSFYLPPVIILHIPWTYEATLSPYRCRCDSGSPSLTVIYQQDTQQTIKFMGF